MKLPKYSFGTGDRFGQQGKAQLKAIMKANEEGLGFVPVWNKSNREHEIIHSKPSETRSEADNAVSELNWQYEYFVDADHINIKTVDNYIDSANFFTLDVADAIGKKPSKEELDHFLDRNKDCIGKIKIPNIDRDFGVSEDRIREIGTNFIRAVKQAGELYRHIESRKGKGNFVTEVSMDEVEEPQSPVEMLFILKALADENIPVQTIAPKFTGRFNKGVDYIGDIEQFTKEFEEDLHIIDYAIKEFGLPDNLKLSIHSGSDKFSIYPIMGNLIKKYDQGIHIKTAGTTWLEEIIGLALAGDEGFKWVQKIYNQAYQRIDELCTPYAAVISVNKEKLPNPDEVKKWTGEQFADAVRHVPDHPEFNPDLRQLLHVGYKVAAEYGEDYIQALNDHAEIVNKQVTENIYNRHIKRLFP